MQHDTYWTQTWQQFRRHRLGSLALLIFLVISLIGIYAPFLASSKPLVAVYDGEIYFPLFRYLFHTGFFTKRLDIFYNLLMFSLPLGLLFRRYRTVVVALVLTHCALFLYLILAKPVDPASDPTLNSERQRALKNETELSWDFELRYMTPYAKLNLLLREFQRDTQDQRLQKRNKEYAAQEKEEWLRSRLREERATLRRSGVDDADMPSEQDLRARILSEADPEELAARLALPTLWRVALQNESEEIQRQTQLIERLGDSYRSEGEARIRYIEDRRTWITKNIQRISFQLRPLLRDFHWEDDAGGEQDLNRYISWWELSRINRKDLVAGLLFGTRISIVVGVLSVFLALMIGIPVGALAGYFGGRFDILVSRMLEIWESMPVFFMLLMVVAVTQSKSIFLVIAVIGLFGWTGFSRFIRGEFFKQRHLPYVEACQAMGFGHARIIFFHILPNAVPPLLTLLPFAIMGAITSEAGLSFIGLGEEGSCSWGVLMDEGRSAFPGESYLLWPPALLLTTLLVSIALVGDALRDAMDPKMRH